MIEGYKKIEVYENTLKANIALNFLKQNGVDAILTDEYIGDSINIAVKGIKLLVAEKDEDKARELLDTASDDQFPENLSFEINESEERVLNILQEADAFLSGHFKLTSGRHSDKYVEKIKIINQPDKVTELCKIIVERFDDTVIDLVVGPAMGSIVLAFETARLLKTKFAFTQRKDGKMVFRSGFDLKPGMRVLLIEDVITTGGSVQEVIELLEDQKLEVVGIGIIVDRTGGKTDFGYRTESLVTLDIKSFEADECPLCSEKIDLTTPGSSDKK